MLRENVPFFYRLHNFKIRPFKSKALKVIEITIFQYTSSSKLGFIWREFDISGMEEKKDKNKNKKSDNNHYGEIQLLTTDVRRE